MAIKYNVLLPLNLSQAFTYQSDVPVEIGQIVRINFRNRGYFGIIWECNIETSIENIKEIELITDYKLNPTLVEFIKWVANYTMSSVGLVLKMALSIKNFDTEDLPPPLFLSDLNAELSKEQEKIFQDIKENLYKKPIVLDGVTGSGKTEVYLGIAAELITEKQILILLPEISLTEQVMVRIEKYFTQKPLAWHSKMTSAQKRKIWKIIQNGAPLILVGARSALFLPFANLGLIVIDEEHDSSYKQESGVLYHARDMAIVRAHLEKIPIILVSATPSIETWFNIQKEKYHHVKLVSRYGKAQYPNTLIVDLKNSPKGTLSLILKEEIKRTLALKQQVLLFLNKRGFAPILLCTKCGYKLPCQYCSVSLVYHKRINKLKCHHCGFEKYYKESFCPHCPGSPLITWGPGVEKLKEEVEQEFPEAKIFILASDEITSSKRLEESLNKIINKEVDIVIGTQILAKGHHFPHLTLVGVIDADMGLTGVDLRAHEKTFQLLYQVSGRCGRESTQGLVVLQTFSPMSRLIQCMESFDRQQLIAAEFEDRLKYEMPPFSHLAALIFSSKKEHVLKEFVRSFFAIRPKMADVFVLGPIPAPLYFINGLYRYRFLIRTKKSTQRHIYIAQWLSSIKIPVNLTIDIDPQNFL